MATQYTKGNDNEHSRKIRESCNNCSAQKIRCGKQRPSCARCIKKSLACNYSYSQRTGRRASSSYTQTDHAANTSLPATSRSRPRTGDSHSLFEAQTSMTPTVSPRVTPASNFLADSPNDTYLSMLDDTNFFPDLSLDLIPSPVTETAVSRGGSVPNNTTEAVDAMLSMGLPSSHAEPNNLWQIMPDSTSSSTQNTLKPISARLHVESGREGAHFKRQDKPYQRGHDCMALALRVVYDLNVMREPCHIATSDPMTDFQPSQDEVRDVDTVLFLNRDAAQTIKKILSCSCSTDPTISLACYLATTKIVDWYGAAIGAAGQQSEDEAYNNRTTDDNSIHGAMANRIIARPIFMGRYCLDSEVQRAVRAKVVLSELKEHVEPLIGQLPKYHVSSLEGGHDSSMPKDPNSGHCVLRTQLRKVIRIGRNLNASG